MKTKTIYRVAMWILTLSSAGVIFWFSSQTAEQSSAFSGEVTQGLLGGIFTFFQLTAEQQQTAHELVRSVAHVGSFSVLGLFASLLTRSYTERWWIPITVLACGVYAVFDECHQLWFSAGRAFELVDVAKDLIGTLLGVGAVVLFYCCCARLRKEGN